MDLEAHNKPKARQFAVLFEAIGRTGRITNTQQFRKERDPIWAFKRHQHRLPCFRDGNCFVLTHGFVKQTNRWPRSEHKTAVNIMQEDKNRVLQLHMKGQEQ